MSSTEDSGVRCKYVQKLLQSGGIEFGFHQG